MIDTHTHFYDPSRPEGVPWPPRDNDLLYRTVLPADWRALARPTGVTGTVVVEASPWPADNHWLLALADAHDDILGVVGNVRPGASAFAATVAQLAAHPSFCGIRWGGACFRAADRRDEVAAAAAVVAGHRLTLDVLGGVDCFAGVAALAAALPELSIVVNHVGSVCIDSAAPDADWAAGVVQLAAAPNINMKVSGMMELCTTRPAPAAPACYQPTIDALWSAFGEDRLLFGSNWPVCEVAGDYATAVAVTRACIEPFGAAARDKVFNDNARAVYRLGG
jgi:L-fuconolactonase